MKLNESKHGFVVQRMTEVSELNATMYEIGSLTVHRYSASIQYTQNACPA